MDGIKFIIINMDDYSAQIVMQRYILLMKKLKLEELEYEKQKQLRNQINKKLRQLQVESKKYFKKYVIEDLMKERFHPRNFDKFEDWGFDD